MVLVAFIQARMSSSRLPGKVLRPIGGVPVLERVTEAVRRVAGVDRVAVLTSDTESDAPIADWCQAHGVTCHRGSLGDVLDRFRFAMEQEELGDEDAVMRITADCPVLDPDVCGMVARLFRETGADYAHNIAPRSWPDGLDCEIFSVGALKQAAADAEENYDREHVGPFLMRNRHRFSQANLVCPYGNFANIRLTLDTDEDLAFIEKILGHAGERQGFLDLIAAAERAGTDLRSAQAAGATPQNTPLRSVGFNNSQAMLERARRTIPLGSQTFSKSHIQYPGGQAPMFLSHGLNARVWDVDGNEYVDLVNGLLPVVLGYCDQDVDDAIRRQLDRGISFSLATELEAELAERLVRLVPCAEMVRFGKNGSDATTAAIRVSRAATGRDRIALCGYHGWHDWYIGTTSRDLGVPRATAELSGTFPYNDADALEQLLDAHPNQYAAVIMEVTNAVPPAPGFLEKVREVTKKHGTVLIFDEIITGFRFSMGGAQTLFNVIPDLACFGKSMANGMPISAVVGRSDLMMEMENIFFSGTFGGEALSLAGAIATIDKLERTGGIDTLWNRGETIARRFEESASRHGVNDVIKLVGYDPWKILAISDAPQARKEAIRTRLLIELLERGVLVGGGHNVSCSLSDADVEQVCDAYEDAFAVLSAQLAGNGLEEGLPCPAIEPVFKVR